GLEQYLPNTAGIEFWGRSFIAGPQGEILAQASHDKEEILIAEVDLDLQENVRQNWPFFRDRRIDAFADITKRALDEMGRFPAEWEKQQGIVLCFPHNGNDWPGKYGAIQWAFVEFIKKVAAHEEVFLVVDSSQHRERVAEMLETATVNLKKITFIIQKTNRSWMRDSGPIIVKNGKDRE